MNYRRTISKELSSFLKLIVAFFALSLFFRFIFYVLFNDSGAGDYSAYELRKALYIGAKFDLRASILLSLPFWFIGYTLKFINYFIEEKDRLMFSHEQQSACTWLKTFYTFIFILYTAFHLIDLGFYDYLKNRLDASSVVFLKNPFISLQMATESYPVFSGALGSLLVGDRKSVV